jgi:RNA polymerase sigma-70 factor (ECF subfamily)
MAEQITPQFLEQMMHEHGPALELFAAQWTTLPEDCVQEAFLQLVRERQVPDNPLAWLYRVVRNRAISWHRSQERRRRRESLSAAQRPLWSPSPRWSTAELEELTGALRDIEDELREVVIARIWGGLSFEQIAAVVGTSTSTAHRRYEAGLQQLRERLGVRCSKSTNPAKV